MKARVKATGEIKEFAASSGYYRDAQGDCYGEKELDFDVNSSDYWDKLLHQYAGMAMQALLLTNNIRNGDLEGMRECNTNAMAIAYALVEKYKKEE